MPKSKELKVKPDFEFHLGAKNRKIVQDAFQKWAFEKHPLVIKPSYFVLTDLRVSNGSITGYFLDEKEGRKMCNFARKLMKARTYASK